MSSKPQQKQQKGQQQPQKRKADAEAAAPEGKKANKGAQQQQQPKPKAPAAAAAAAPKKQEAGKGAQPQKQQKKAAAAPAPAAAEEEEDDEDDAGEDGMDGEVDEEALAVIEKVQPAADALAAELDAFDDQMQAELYAVQKKYLLKKRPLLTKRDALYASSAPGLWKALFINHQTFLAQLEDVDIEILDHLVGVEVEEKYTAPDASKQQIEAIIVTFTFAAGSKIVKAGKFKKSFVFDDEKETLLCKATPVAQMPFVDAKILKSDSFFASWFSSEGEDDGILAAQDALSSELYVDPLQLYRHVSSGGTLDQEDGSDGEDDDGAGMLFEDEDDEDEEAPQLV